MKLNISFPETGLQKVFEIDNEQTIQGLLDKRISEEVELEDYEDFKGYVFKITGGNDKQGFPMKQGVLTNQRVRLLFRKGMKCYRERRPGMRKRKSVCGCIVGTECSVLSLVIVQKGEKEIAGITDSERKRSLAPKRAARIRKAWQVDKDMDVRAFNHEKKYTSSGNGKQRSKRPKIMRLITPTKLKRWRKLKAIKSARYKKAAAKAAVYKELLERRKRTAS